MIRRGLAHLPLVLAAFSLAACRGGADADSAAPADTAAAVDTTTASSAPAPPVSKEAEVNDPELTTTSSGLKYRDLTVGTGDEAGKGDTAVVHYTGWLVDGTKFDSSVDRGEPFRFPVGAARVIKGWDEGVAGMREGGKRRLVIPPDLGYGPGGTPDGTIPPNATLLFDVELIEVNPS